MAKAMTETKAKYTVLKPFRDINNFSKEYKEGDDVSTLEPSRLDNLVTLGLVSDGSNSAADTDPNTKPE